MFSLSRLDHRFAVVGCEGLCCGRRRHEPQEVAGIVKEHVVGEHALDVDVDVDPADVDVLERVIEVTVSFGWVGVCDRRSSNGRRGGKH